MPSGIYPNITGSDARRAGPKTDIAFTGYRLVLFAAPDAWKRMVEQAMQLESRQLRTVGGVVMALGLLSLYLVH